MRATYLIRASLGRGIEKKRGRKKKKKKKHLCVSRTSMGEHRAHSSGQSRLLGPTWWCTRPAQVAPLAGPLMAPSTPPAVGHAAIGHRALARDRATRASNPPMALGNQPCVSWQAESRCPSPGACSRASTAHPHSSFSGELSLQLESRAAQPAGASWVPGSSCRHFNLFIFPQLGRLQVGSGLWLPAGCVLFLLKPPHWFLHRDGEMLGLNTPASPNGTRGGSPSKRPWHGH